MRRKVKVRKRITLDARYHDPLVGKFINHLMKDGKKSVAQNIMYDALVIAARKSKQKELDIFLTALKNTSPLVEVVSRRIGGATYQIPRDVQGERRTTLAMRWLIEAARKQKGQSMKEKLAAELLAAAKKEGGAMRKREEVHRVAMANRAFAHFARRW